jgi:hypothetical protein
MNSNIAIMVVLIVLITSIAGVIRARYGVRRDRNGNELPAQNGAETERMRDEIKVLKDRIAVLERIATDRNHSLEQEFERLRDR